jgi:hypothetical protein
MARTAPQWPTDAERRRINEILARHHDERPEGVRRVTANFGEDQDGNPAVFLEMIVGKDVSPTKEKIEELNDYIQIILNTIIDNNFEYWPYARTIIEE